VQSKATASVRSFVLPRELQRISDERDLSMPAAVAEIASN
jgi:hypothetical protein